MEDRAHVVSCATLYGVRCEQRHDGVTASGNQGYHLVESLGASSKFNLRLIQLSL